MHKFRFLAVGIPMFLLLGLITGLSRFGLFSTNLSIHHGVLMLNGFVGGLITVERTLSRTTPSNILALVLLIGGVVSAASGFNWGLWLVTGTIMLLVIEEVRNFQSDQWTYHLTQLTGLLCWLTANVKFQISGFYPSGIPFWQAFILATRLEKINRIQDIPTITAIWLYVATVSFALSIV